MAIVPERIRDELKQPLGRFGWAEELPGLAKKYRIVSVGDISTLLCLENGVEPFVAVFDFKYMRQELEAARKEKLDAAFPGAIEIDNPPGTLSDKLPRLAQSLLQTGGALKINGEEDMAALVFIAFADEKTLVIYGQPDEGLVMVEPGEEIRKKAKGILKELNLLRSP